MKTESITIQRTRKDFQTQNEVKWCPGCGDYVILATLQRVFAEMNLDPDNTVFVSGIGCAARFPYYMNTYGMHTIHGRAPTIATGLKMTRPDLSVWLVTGDGDALSIGGNHLMHALRRNLDINILLFNNRIYGLTKGQYSPTSQRGKVAKSTPLGSVEEPIDPVSVALASGATFVARTTDSDPKHLGEVLKAAAAHKGTSFVEIYQNCVVFNDNEFVHISDKKTRNHRRLMLEDGKPMIFDDGKQGIEFCPDTLAPKVVNINKENPLHENLLVHMEDVKTPLRAQVLAQLKHPEFPVPLGVFHRIARPVYEESYAEQSKALIEKKGEGKLEALLRSGNTWTV